MSVTSLSIKSKVVLNNGVEMPMLGLGTWTLTGKQARQAALWALEEGYRLIDTATIYGNERDIGAAIKESKLPRNELFITSKVWSSDHGYKNALNAFEKSLKKLDLSYIDLYLIHWPDTTLNNETWKALIKIYEEKKARAIGVSNFTISDLESLIEEFSIVPALNQVEFSPLLYQKELLSFCKSKNIALEAYCPLTRGRRLDDPQILNVAKKHNKSAAQVLIRWGLQHNVIQIPKSVNQDHIRENSVVFDFKLDEKDMHTLDSMNEDFRVVSLKT